MLKIPSPNIQMEEQRLVALYSYDVLGEGLDSELDNLVKLAVQITAVNKAFITFVDRETIVLKATYGFKESEVIANRNGSVCQFAMYNDVYIVPDIRKSEDFAGSYLLNSHEDLIFYASVSLVDSEGFSLGCLCVADDKERVLTALQVESLQTLSLQIIAQLSLRRKNLQLQVQTKRSEEFIDVFQASPEIHCILNRDGDILFINQAAYALLGYHSNEVLGKSMWSFCYKEDVARVVSYLQEGLKI